MTRLSFSSVMFWLLVSTSAACGSNPTCKQGCDKLRACNLRTSGISCSEQTTGCTTPDNSCAQCLEDRSCSEIRGGACASACPGLTP